MSVLFRNSQTVAKVLPGSVTALAEYVLEEEGASGKEVSVLFVDDVEISRLNARHLGRNGPTDVLAFPMSEGEKADVHPEILGDVVVSAERALDYAAEHGLQINDELSLYLIHGILHLLGYDDVNTTHKAKMRKREKELLRKAAQKGLLIRGIQVQTHRTG
jgi:probable rRNA maturation factor